MSAKSCVIGVFLAAAFVADGHAAEPAHPLLSGLERCAEVADVTARATCYDQALAQLSRAVRAGDIMIVARQEAQAAQRGAFGLNLPALNLFDRLGPSAAPLEMVVGEVKRADRDAYGRWVIELADGAVWRQTDDEAISPSPRAGSRAEIRRVGLGSYFMKIDGRRGVRARRSQ